MNMHIAKHSILIGLALSVSACGTQNRGLESVHQPVVTQTNYALDVGAGYDGLSTNEVSRVQGWFESLRLGYGDRVSVDMPSGSSGVAARDAVAGIAATYGLLLDTTAPVTEGEVSPGSLRIIVSRAKASVPGCPDWSRKNEINLNEHNASNFGCSVNSNLASMVANPQDLVLGQIGNSSIDPGTSGKAIKSYRDKKPTGDEPLKAEKTRSGN
jgi:pilus assembly protein CpaD